MDPAEKPDDDALPWSLTQRRALIGVLALVFVWLVYLAVTRRQFVPNPMPADSPLAGQLADRIDPNTADLATLAALPTLGERGAKALIDYRQRVAAREPGAIAYRSPEDLLKVRGIGAATVNNLGPYLLFPDSKTTTQPGE